MSDFSKNFSISGLETLTVVMPLAGQFQLSGKIQMPRLSQMDPSDPQFLNLPSSVVVTINQNGSPIFTSTAGDSGFSIPIKVALKDVITVVLSSGNAADAVLNSIKCVVSIG